MSENYPIAKLRPALMLFAGGRAAQALGRMALVLITVRLLTSEDYGAYMLLVGVSEMLLQTFSLGILSVGQRFLPQLLDSASRRDVRRFAIGISALQFVVLMIVVAVCWSFWDDLMPLAGFDAQQVEQSRSAIWILLFVPAFRFVADLLETLLAQGKAQAARALMPLGRLIGIGVLVLGGVQITLERVLYIDSVVTVICLILAWWFTISSLRLVTTPSAPKPLPIKAMVRHAWHMSAVDLTGSASAPGAIRIALASTLGVSESGLFAFLQSLARLVSRYLPSVLLRGLVRPMMISRIGRTNGIQLMQLGTALLWKSNLLMIAVGAMVVFIGGDRIVSIASGGRFTGSGDTLLLMLLVLAITSQRLVLEMLMQILNQTHILRLTGLLAPITLGLVWLSAGYGLNVAILVSASGITIGNIITMARLRSITGEFRRDWRGSAGIILPAMAAAAFGWAVEEAFGTWVALLAAGLLLIVLLAAAKPFLMGELRIADRGLGGFIRRMLTPFAREATL